MCGVLILHLHAGEAERGESGSHPHATTLVAPHADSWTDYECMRVPSTGWHVLFTAARRCAHAPHLPWYGPGPTPKQTGVALVLHATQLLRYDSAFLMRIMLH